MPTATVVEPKEHSLSAEAVDCCVHANSTDRIAPVRTRIVDGSQEDRSRNVGLRHANELLGKLESPGYADCHMSSSLEESREEIVSPKAATASLPTQQPLGNFRGEPAFEQMTLYREEPASERMTLGTHQEEPAFEQKILPSCSSISWPLDLMERIRLAISMECKKPKKPEFSFELTKEVGLKNYLVLKKHGLDLSRALSAQAGSPMSYGSEFRPVAHIEQIFSRHPNWQRLKSILECGSDWKLEELSEEERVSDLVEALEFGNHKGATMKPDLLKELVLKDVQYGYAFVLPLNKILSVPGVCMAPMNISPQHSIDEYGNIVPKDRLTHDRSYKWGSGTSVNSRVIEGSTLPCIFGQALRRFINKVVAMRLAYPECRIYCTKIDYKSAFRRMTLSSETALRCCTQLPADDLAMMYLRFTFGGAPCPPDWGALSQSVL